MFLKMLQVYHLQNLQIQNWYKCNIFERIRYVLRYVVEPEYRKQFIVHQTKGTKKANNKINKPDKSIHQLHQSCYYYFYFHFCFNIFLSSSIKYFYCIIIIFNLNLFSTIIKCYYLFLLLLLLLLLFTKKKWYKDNNLVKYMFKDAKIPSSIKNSN